MLGDNLQEDAGRNRQLRTAAWVRSYEEKTHKSDPRHRGSRNLGAPAKRWQGRLSSQDRL
jgi:hypothetical protein